MKNKLLILLTLTACGIGLVTGNSFKIDQVSAANMGDDQLWCSGYDIEPLQPGEYTLAAYGDTQKCIEYHPEIMQESMQWLVNNKTNLNLKYVISCGDIVDDVDYELDPAANPDKQLQDAVDCFDILKNNDINFSLLLGNHDYEDMAFNKREMTLFNQYFPLSYYNGVSGYKGSMDTTIENTYHFFENGNDLYMIVTLGHHPTDEILDWANNIISSHPERKAIVVSHSYIDGGGYGEYKDGKPYYDFYTGGYGGRNEDGEHIWDKVVRKNSNVFMVLCGHELTFENHRIGHSVVYGDAGNTIHQIINNPADIDLPYGGAGLISLFTFRNDGTVDTRFYSPSLNKYMNPDSQYSFDLVSKIPTISTQSTIIGKQFHEDIEEDFSSYSIGSTEFANNVYEYSNMAITNKGLAPTSDNAYITYKFAANQNEVIKNLFPTFIYTAENRNCGILVSTSIDNKNFVPFSSVDGTSTGVIKQAIKTYEAKFNLRNYVAGNKETYIRLSFLEGSKDNIAISSLNFQQKMARVIYEDAGKFGFNLNFSQYQNFEVEGWGKNAIYQDFLTVYGGFLGTGKKADIAGAIGTAIWQFDAPTNSTIDSLKFSANGRVSLGDYNFPWCLKLSLSINNGEFVDVYTKTKGGDTSFSYDMKSKVQGATTVKVKLQLHGASWNDVGLTNLSFDGSYNYGINYFVGEGTADPTNPSTYAVSSKSIQIKDPTAPNHYDFVGWYDNANFEGDPIFNIAAGTFGPLNLYAKYEPISHNITYNLNGGKNSPNNPKTYLETKTTTLEDASRSGYTFMGWYDNEAFEGNKISTIEIGSDDDISLYAKFLKSYRISYVLSGGKIAEEDNITYFTNETNVNLPTPTKEGYKFEGWYLEKDYQTQISKIEPGRNENLIVYAKWSKQTKSGGGCNGSLASASLIALTSLLGIGIIFTKKKKQD